MEAVLQVQSISKVISKKKAVDNISFECRAGEIFGLLGSDGAGKTPILRMVLGLCAPDTGRILVCGAEVPSPVALDKTAGFAGEPEFYGFLTGRQNLRQLARIRGNAGEKRIDELLERCGLALHADEKVRFYSAGQRRRLAVALAALYTPELLVLDEPTLGLDPAGMKEMRTLIRQLAHEQGACVLLSSHMISETELICDQTAMLDCGRLIQMRQLSDWMGASDGATVRVAFRFVVTPLDRAKRIVTKAELGRVLDVTDDHIDVQLLPDELSELNRRLVEGGVALHMVAPVRELSGEVLPFTEEEGGGFFA